MYTGGNRVVDFLGMGWRRNSDLHNDQDCDPKVATRMRFLKLFNHFNLLLQMQLGSGLEVASLRFSGRRSIASVGGQLTFTSQWMMLDFYGLLVCFAYLCFVFALLPFLLLFLAVPSHTVEGFCLLVEPLLQRLDLSSLRCLQRHTLLALADHMIRMHIFSMSTWQMASRRAIPALMF